MRNGMEETDQIQLNCWTNFLHQPHFARLNLLPFSLPNGLTEFVNNRVRQELQQRLLAEVFE